jgi:uncharacterized OsmC-like protein
MVLTMAAVAANKGICVSRLNAEVECHTELKGPTSSSHFTSHLDLGDGLSPREQRILYNAARQCEVHKMLRGEVTFEERIT